MSQTAVASLVLTTPPPLMEHPADVIKVSSDLRGRALERSEIAALLEVARSDLTPIGFRDAALIVILRGAGLRRAEVVNLDLKDFDPSTGTLKIRKGKGRKERTVYLPSGLISVVEDWIEIRGQKIGPFVCPINKGGPRSVESPYSLGGALTFAKTGARIATHTFFTP